jgi:translation initiation factor IF-1
MSGHLEFKGKIAEGSHGIFQVVVFMEDEDGRLSETEQRVQCTIGGKLRKNKINLTVGDMVRIKVSPYDLERGFIIYRL